MWDHECRLLEAEKKLKKANKTRAHAQAGTQAPQFRTSMKSPSDTRKEAAVREASRCLGCKKSPCIAGCPVDIDIPAFIDLIRHGDFIGAIHKIKEKNSLPAICGRVCPQEEQCEVVCVLGKKGQPIAIGRLERFVADYEFQQGDVRAPSLPESTGKRVAVIGAGPAGLVRGQRPG